ncbi:sensor histidine kinase [Streptomyces sp. SudanB66_2053]|uniref:sensor histidine kinase n=1 Tax=Streptomyces sp. SudanB66_2053 TaxID=3035277 RepID=UPI003F57D167
MRKPGRWWRQKTTPEKVETYTRWSFHFFAVCEIVGIGLPTYLRVGERQATTLLLLVVIHAATATVTVAKTLDWTRGRRAQPVHHLWGFGALTAVLAVAAAVIAGSGPMDGNVEKAALSVFVGLQGFGVGVIALAVHADRRRVVGVVCSFAVGASLVAFMFGVSWLSALTAGCALLVTGAVCAATAVFSVWLLNAVYELDEAKETRARLAVAEERLRFGRDLHDVLGRNLAVIALKSELAVQLSRRGRPEAVEQMIETQRIAQESQREVRDVVRGYREADLEVELAGAQGVLSAAGIDARVTGKTTGMSAETQSALGWVVREATTNVLRHGNAKKVTVVVRRSKERVVLTVENDGAGDDIGSGLSPGGTGLAGLRERLSEVDGVLDAGIVDKGVFRVTAEVPLSPHSGAVLEVAS